LANSKLPFVWPETSKATARTEHFVKELIPPSILASSKLDFGLRVWRIRKLELKAFRSLIFASFTFNISFQSEVPTAQQLDQHNFDLVACEEPTWTSVVAVAKDNVIH
jgi:hypothetical protein